MITIQPQYLPLSTLLTNRLFVIPEYQRTYSWTTTERNDLFNDIINVHSKGKDESHFMSAIVCLRREKITLGIDEFYRVEIVDGQQRLTTLIILLNTIKLSLNKNNTGENRILNNLQELLVKPEADELLLLQTNHDSSHHFSNFLRKGTATNSNEANTIADREILKAIEDCYGFISMWKNQGKTLAELTSLINNRLYFLLHEIQEEKTVYTVFEVLNSRGLDVSWLDRLKSILMAAAFNLTNIDQSRLIRELHTLWRDIYSTIGLKQGLSTEALRFAATLKDKNQQNRLLSEKQSVESLRQTAQNATEILNIARWLLDVTKAYETVTSNIRLNAITRISQVRLLAVAIHLRSDLSKDQQNILLTRWEKISFRIYGMLRNDARTRVGDYVRLACKITNEQISFNEIDNQLAEIGKSFPINTATKALKESDCYNGWENELRYFMFRYEEHLTKQQGINFENEQWNKIWLTSSSDSIEHILAKSQATEKNKHRLGNLMILPPKLNSKLNDKPPKDKAEHYNKTGLLTSIEVADIIKNTGWDTKTIQEREANLIKWAATEWND